MKTFLKQMQMAIRRFRSDQDDEYKDIFMTSLQIY